MPNFAKTCSTLTIAGAILLSAGAALAQTWTLQSPNGVQAYFLPYPSFDVPIGVSGTESRFVNPTGAYVLLVWNDPRVESDSTLWNGYWVRRFTPGITRRPLTLHCPSDTCKGELIGQLKQRDRITSFCIGAHRPCDSNFNYYGTASGFFFNGFHNNLRSDGSYLIDFKVQWRGLASGTDEDLRGLWGSAGTNLVAVGTNGTILQYGGAAWTPTASPLPNVNLNGVHGTSQSNVFAVGDLSTLLHFNGSQWDTMPRPLTWARQITPGEIPDTTYVLQSTITSLASVWTGGASSAFAVGDSCRLMSYNGTQWDTIPRPLTLATRVDSTGTTYVTQARITHLHGVWGSSPTDVFAVGDSSLVLHFDGSSWSQMAVGDTTNLYAVWGTSSGNVLAAGDYGAILRYDGTAWRPMKSDTRRSLRTVWGTSAGDVFAAGLGGEILHYDGNAGGTWSPMSSVSPNPVYGVWGSTGTNVLAAGGAGAIVRWDGTAADVDECDRCRAFLDVANLSGFSSLYSVTSIDTTIAQYNVYTESDIDHIVNVLPASPPATNLEHVAVVPNPYKGSAEWDLPGRRGIHFIHLPDGATVRIYTTSLELVRQLKLNAQANPGGPTGELEWDVRNANGQEVKSGIYLYQVDAPHGLSKEGHFVIIK